MSTEGQGRSLKRYKVNGPCAGRDCVLAGFRFVSGECSISASAQEHDSIARVLWYYQAEEVKDDGQRNVQTDQAGSVEREGRPKGGEPASSAPESGNCVGHAQAEDIDQGRRLVPSGDGSQAGVEMLRNAVLGLDPSNDAHWTSAGRPAIAAVEAALGKPITRAQIEAALPGFVRKASS
jgi:hypothetical protein